MDDFLPLVLLIFSLNSSSNCFNFLSLVSLIFSNSSRCLFKKEEKEEENESKEERKGVAEDFVNECENCSEDNGDDCIGGITEFPDEFVDFLFPIFSSRLFHFLSRNSLRRSSSSR